MTEQNEPLVRIDVDEFDRKIEHLRDEVAQKIQKIIEDTFEKFAPERILKEKKRIKELEGEILNYYKEESLSWLLQDGVDYEDLELGFDNKLVKMWRMMVTRPPVKRVEFFCDEEENYCKYLGCKEISNNDR